MGISKSAIFSKKLNQLTLLGKAFSHPARVAIIRFLYKSGYATCGAIVEQLPLSQSTVSQHLAELKKLGFIDSEKEGVKIWYSLNQKEFQRSSKHFIDFLESFPEK